MSDFEICYLPAQWRRLEAARLRISTCAVIDVIRATSTVVTALANGAGGIRVVASVAEAFALKEQNPTALLAGERGGRALPGFDLGNSPREMTAARVGGRDLILTTTNGTQALAACHGARAIVTAGFLNLEAAAARMLDFGPPWIVVCAGHEGDFGIDDAIVAGALAEAMGRDHAMVNLYRSVRAELTPTFFGCAAGRELVRIGLGDDVPGCTQRDVFSLAPMMGADDVLRVK